jgi:hypothetical protein
MLFLIYNDSHAKIEFFIENEDTVVSTLDSDDCDCFFGPNIQFIKQNGQKLCILSIILIYIRDTLYFIDIIIYTFTCKF